MSRKRKDDSTDVAPSEHGKTRGDQSDNLNWSLKVPLIRNSILLRELGIQLGVGAAVIVVMMLLVTWGDYMAAAQISLMIIGIVVGLFLVALLVLNIIYRGSFEARFHIGRDGAGFELGKLVKKVNTAAVLISLLGRNPVVIGAALIAKARESEFINWDEVRDITLYKKDRVIYFRRRSLVRPLVLFCSPANFDAAVALVEKYAPRVRINVK